MNDLSLVVVKQQWCVKAKEERSSGGREAGPKAGGLGLDSPVAMTAPPPHIRGYNWMHREVIPCGLRYIHTSCGGVGRSNKVCAFDILFG